MSLFREKWLETMSKDYEISFIIPTYLINLIKKTKLLDANLAIELDNLYKIINNFLLQISIAYTKYSVFFRFFCWALFLD